MKSRLLFWALALCSATVAADNYPTSLYVIGDATPAQWNSDDVVRMVTVEEGVYEYTGDFTEGRMRFVTTYDFAPGYGPAMATTVVGDNLNETYLDLTTGSHELEFRSDYTSPDKSFKVTAAGRYKFRVDLTGETPVVEVSDGTDQPDQWATNPEAVYAVGSATNAGWAIENSIALRETAFDSGIYQGSLYLNTADEGAELKFMVMQKWNNRMYVATAANTPVDATGEYDLKYTTSGDEDWKFIVGIEGLYDVTVDTKNLKMIISEPQDSYPEQLWLVGPAVGGWVFDNNKVLVSNDEEGVYSWTGDLAEGELKFFAGDNFGAVAYGAESNMTPLQEGILNVIMLSSDVDNKFNVLSDQVGNYTLILDLKAMTLNVDKNEGPSTGIDEAKVVDWVQESYGIVCDEARAMALYDISGRKVASVNDTLLPYDGLNAGVYVLVIETAQGRTTHKIAVR
ncbi:SusF/SusE family outer membrane protein [Barnesiella sp. An55]|uniref:SusF/SusE family outer membrane protein n=1 Tax=Barnesiella sp. An55 TaxID=1965646 RepID=UPI000B3AFF3D|nr:SusF/SusE family outer membrane protein [Barnesiella sp. An55]OUN72845.1 hypothetical protein B5G10_06660 [Barnesiella sp. An55]